MKIAVLSDTHGLLRPELLARLEGVEAILHAGDVGARAVLERLQEIAPVYAVRGNNDWALPSLPRTRAVSLAGVNFFLVHKRQDVPSALTGADVVIYGHTHWYACSREGNVLWLNPGSCSWPRLDPAPTFARMTLESGSLQVEKAALQR